MNAATVAMPTDHNHPSVSAETAAVSIIAVKLADRSKHAASGGLYHLTSTAGHNTSPLWDAATDRILFTSDRGRSLELSALFALPVPPALW